MSGNKIIYGDNFETDGSKCRLSSFLFCCKQ